MTTKPGFHYDERQQRTQASAKAIASIARELVNPTSVIDVGCGVGTWLAEFRDHGAERVRGLDGEYVDREHLQIDAQDFVACDLTAPPDQGGDWDLALSLEVAEHLPPESADSFVNYLCGLSPVVLFGAAIPNQGGYQHINEQWPSYWASLFEANSYRCFDAIRWQVWDNAEVLPWYSQNTLLFVHRDHYQTIASRATQVGLSKPFEGDAPISVVNPRQFQRRVDRLIRAQEKTSVRAAARQLVKASLRRTPLARKRK